MARVWFPACKLVDDFHSSNAFGQVGEAAEIGRRTTQALVLELETWPNPGLVSHVDNGAYDDMDAVLLRASATTLEPFFTRSLPRVQVAPHGWITRDWHSSKP